MSQKLDPNRLMGLITGLQQDILLHSAMRGNTLRRINDLTGLTAKTLTEVNTTEVEARLLIELADSPEFLIRSGHGLEASLDKLIQDDWFNKVSHHNLARMGCEMARKPTQTDNAPTLVSKDDLPGLPTMVEASNTLACDIITGEEANEVLNAGINLGRLESMLFFATLSNSACLTIYEKLKKSKGWRHIRNPENSDYRNFSSLDEFCRIKLGRSYKRLQEIANNRNELGQEAFEQAEKLGLRQVDYNIIKALPAPKQEIIKEALAGEASKEEIQRALRELAAVDQKEIESLTNERDKARLELQDAQSDLEAKDAVMARNAMRIAELEVRVHDKVVAVTDWPDALEPITQQIAEAGRAIAKAISTLETCRITLMETGQSLEADLQPRYEAALVHVAEVYETALAKAEREIAKERVTFDKSLGAYGEDV